MSTRNRRSFTLRVNPRNSRGKFVDQKGNEITSRPWDPNKETWKEYQAHRREFSQQLKENEVDQEIPLRVDFSPIDAKDFGVVLTNAELYGKASWEDNLDVITVAEDEYLRRLWDLQKEIDAKYGPLLRPHGSEEPVDPDIKKKAEEIRKQRFDDLKWQFALYRH